jgi:hypothetical protein
MRYFDRTIALVGMGCVIVMFLLLVRPASAHSWYPGECCSDKDCRELQDWEVTEQNGGFSVASDKGSALFHTPYAKVRPSQDKKFHKCEGTSSLLCFFAPMSNM